TIESRCANRRRLEYRTAFSRARRPLSRRFVSPLECDSPDTSSPAGPPRRCADVAGAFPDALLRGKWKADAAVYAGGIEINDGLRLAWQCARTGECRRARCGAVHNRARGCGIAP